MRSSTGLPGASLICVLACLFLGACSAIPRIPVQGEIFGQRVATTVDSEVARYYLERYAQGRHENPETDKRISALYRAHGSSLPSREELKAIAMAFSVDFAALFFAERVLDNACNKALNRRFARYLENDTRVDADVASAYQIHLVALPPTGSVEEGAHVLAAEIARRSRSGKKILIAGTSAAGPVIHLVLGELLDARELRSIKAWLNLGGILHGTPLVDYFEEQPRRLLLDVYAWVKGWDTEAVMSMATAPSRKRFSRLQLDSDIVVINYLAIPLSGQLSRFGGTGYRMLRPEGPNDGLVLLTDVIAPGSLTVVALGSDHFLAEDPEIDRKSVALMKLVVAYAKEDTTIACAVKGDATLRQARRINAPGL